MLYLEIPKKDHYKSLYRKENKHHSENVLLAMEISERMHSGQLYGDKPYYDYHIIGVLYIAHLLQKYHVVTYESLICTLLHDVVEDTPMTLQILRSLFDDRVADTVGVLTKKNDNYDEYLKGILACKEASFFKLCDSIFNYNNCIVNGTKRSEKYKNNIARILEEHSYRGLTLDVALGDFGTLKYIRA